ncbi:MAG: DUF1704 domain-containing protein [Hellea sp.]|nr:DUF1704 domain-containing protein [Hellea sp.]
MPALPALRERQIKAAGHLNAAMSSIRILGSLIWDEDHKKAFLKSGSLPKPQYEAVDLKACFEHVKDARQLIENKGVVGEWLTRAAESIETTALMLGARGTAEFFTHSSKLYGVPTETLIDRKTRVIDLARHMDDTLNGLDVTNLVIDGYEKFIDAKEFAERLRIQLDYHFDDARPAIKLVSDIPSKALAGSKRIRINKDAKFTLRDVDQLLQHEALIHVATTLNGKRQSNFPLLGRAHARVTEIQEGLAVFAEIISGAMDPRRFRRLADRVIAIQMSIDGADFKEVFDYYRDCNNDPEVAYDNTRRIFRGGVISGGAPFTKDMVYLNGLLRVHNFMRTVVKLGRADLIRLIFVGKLDLEDIPALANLVSEGLVERPKYMPPWAKDLRFLVSYMSYSGFLNQVKLPGFQAYYENAISDVPELWGALG